MKQGMPWNTIPGQKPMLSNGNPWIPKILISAMDPVLTVKVVAAKETC